MWIVLLGVEACNLRERRNRETCPKGVDASLGGIAVQPTAVGISRQAVHDGPADATGLVDLKAEVIVGAGHGVVVLMDHEVRAVGAASTALVQL